MENKLHRLVFLSIVFFFAIGVQAQKRNARYVEYINKYSDLAVEQMKLHKIPASITLAQGLLVSNAVVLGGDVQSVMMTMHATNVSVPTSIRVIPTKTIPIFSEEAPAMLFFSDWISPIIKAGRAD